MMNVFCKWFDMQTTFFIKKTNFILFFFICALCLAQQEKHFSGVVRDVESNEVISFAHFMYDSNKGSISNDKGVFEIFALSDSILISVSAVGYQSLSKKITHGHNNILYLAPKIVKLNEISVLFVNPEKELIKKVIERIPENYPNSLEKIYGKVNENVFHDSLNQYPIYKAESDIKVDKFSYANRESWGNVEIIKSSINIIDLDSLMIKFYAGVHTVHSYDFVMKRSGPLSLSNLHTYLLKIRDTVFYDSKKLIRLNYSNIKEEGTLYIDSKSYSIVKINHNLKPLALEKDVGGILKPHKRFFKKLNIEYDHSKDGKWRLKFIHYNTGFRVKNKKRSFYLNNTFYVNGFESQQKVIPINSRFLFTDILFNHAIINKKQLNNLKTSNLRNNFSSFITKLSFDFKLSVLPLKVNSHVINFQPLNKVITIPDKSYLLYIYSLVYRYALRNDRGVSLQSSSSFKSKQFSNTSIGIWKKGEISLNGKLGYFLDVKLGHRQNRLNNKSFAFDSPFNYFNKKFDSKSISLYSNQRSFTLDPSFTLLYKITPKVTVGAHFSYVVYLSNSVGLLVEEKNEFWFWNKSKVFNELDINRTRKTIVDNNLEYGFTLNFKF